MQTVTFAIAVLGAVLGLYNAWRNWIQDRVRIRVNVSYIQMTDGTRGISITVVNLSAFAVTLTHFGFDLLGTTDHAQIIQPIFVNRQTLPVRLESRTSCAVIEPFTALPADRWQIIDRCYVSTACGLQIKGGRAFFNKYRPALAKQL